VSEIVKPFSNVAGSSVSVVPPCALPTRSLPQSRQRRHIASPYDARLVFPQQIAVSFLFSLILPVKASALLTGLATVDARDFEVEMQLIGASTARGSVKTVCGPINTEAVRLDRLFSAVDRQQIRPVRCRPFRRSVWIMVRTNQLFAAIAFFGSWKGIGTTSADCVSAPKSTITLFPIVACEFSSIASAIFFFNRGE